MPKCRVHSCAYNKHFRRKYASSKTCCIQSEQTQSRHVHNDEYASLAFMTFESKKELLASVAEEASGIKMIGAANVQSKKAPVKC